MGQGRGLLKCGGNRKAERKSREGRRTEGLRGPPPRERGRPDDKIKGTREGREREKGLLLTEMGEARLEWPKGGGKTTGGGKGSS